MEVNDAKMVCKMCITTALGWIGWILQEWDFAVPTILIFHTLQYICKHLNTKPSYFLDGQTTLMPFVGLNEAIG